MLATQRHGDHFEDSLQTAWLAFCAYTWTAPTVFRWMLQREVQTLQI